VGDENVPTRLKRDALRCVGPGLDNNCVDIRGLPQDEVQTPSDRYGYFQKSQFCEGGRRSRFLASVMPLRFSDWLPHRRRPFLIHKKFSAAQRWNNSLLENWAERKQRLSFSPRKIGGRP
jgi:hypothetical protein